MSVFKNRRTAVIVTVILCLLALVIGVRRSVGRQAADILEQFESGVRSSSGIRSISSRRLSARRA